MPKFKKHIFICMNQREPGHPRGCCDPTGQGQLQRLFRTKLAQRRIELVRANNPEGRSPTTISCIRPFAFAMVQAEYRGHSFDFDFVKPTLKPVLRRFVKEML